jgi:5'-nucleotidase/UDP-sugar diphosphatase
VKLLNKLFFSLSFLLFLLSSCNQVDNNEQDNNKIHQLVIYSVNDVHSQIQNFAKIKYIVDEQRKQSDVLLLSSGDLFSGSPFVDNFSPKGFPMIDLMNKVGFDASNLGNHEFDYGQKVLQERIDQAHFPFVCANADFSNSQISNVDEYVTLNIGDLKVVLLGLIETDGKLDATIPSTHPWRVVNIDFSRPESVISKYSNLKNDQDADLYILLSHLGLSKSNGKLGDVQVSESFPYFDLIIGGHSHSKHGESVNGMPIFQSGSNLAYMGKISLEIKNSEIIDYSWELINLWEYPTEDHETKLSINEYLSNEDLYKVIGNAQNFHNIGAVGSFYTDALRRSLNADISFQNGGGVRNNIQQGDIRKLDIFSVSPFNNGVVIYEMSIAQVKNFLKNSESGFYYSGINIQNENGLLTIRNQIGVILDDNLIVKVAINDYIAAVHDSFFPEMGVIHKLTAAETLIYFLENIQSDIDYSDKNNYWRY